MVTLHKARVGSVSDGKFPKSYKRFEFATLFALVFPAIPVLRKGGIWRGLIYQDIELLEQALSRVREVMTHLNEEKRRTEGQIHIFDIYSEIENCPASVVSSHRR